MSDDVWLKGATAEQRLVELGQHVLAVLCAIDRGEPFSAHPAAIESARYSGYVVESGNVIDLTPEGRAHMEASKRT
jgi:hypothetical protein